MTYRDKVNELLEKLEKDIRPDWEEEKTERLKQAVNYEKTDRLLIRALYPDRDVYKRQLLTRTSWSC